MAITLPVQRETLADEPGILEAGPDGVVDFANPQARELLGEPLLGQTLRALGLADATRWSPHCAAVVLEASRVDGRRIQIAATRVPLGGQRTAIACVEASEDLDDTLTDAMTSTATRLQRLAEDLVR